MEYEHQEKSWRAWQWYYEEYGPRIHKFVSNRFLLQPEIVDEVVSETFIRAYQYWGKANAPNFGGYRLRWLYNIAANCAIDTIRKEKISQSEVFSESIIQGDVEAHLENIDVQIHLRQAFYAYFEKHPASRCPLLVTLVGRERQGFKLDKLATVISLSADNIESMFADCRTQGISIETIAQGKYKREMLCPLILTLIAEGNTMAEIATLIGQNVVTTRQWTSRCRKDFRKYLSNYM